MMDIAEDLILPYNEHIVGFLGESSIIMVSRLAYSIRF